MMNCPHCDTHIDEHPASRCLDAWVAETVMGRTVHFDVTRWIDEEAFRGSMRPYSTSIAAAWEVERKIEELKLKARYVQALLSGMLFMDVAVNNDEDMWWLLAHASPLDRCRAAIKACQ